MQLCIVIDMRSCRTSMGRVVGKKSYWVPRAVIIICSLALISCASTQLNYNTRDLASTVDTLITDQVLQNLSKFIDSVHAIPSQVAIINGAVTTANSITPTVTAPLNLLSTVANTAATALAAPPTTTITNASTLTRANAGLSVAASDQWSQTWGIVPVTDPEQLRRLRVLYQYGASQIDQRDLQCNYATIVGKDTAPSELGSVIVPAIDGKKTVTVIIGPSGKQKQKVSYWVWDCVKGHIGQKEIRGWLQVKADPAFLNDPSCVLCISDEYPPFPAPDGSGSRGYLLVANRRLKTDWLHSSSSPLGLPSDAIVLGYFRNKYLYVTSNDDLNHFYEFSLFILEATAQSASSATGRPPILIAPGGNALIQ
jgi:hypothetical protein